MGKQQMIEIIGYIGLGVTLPIQYAIQYYFYKNFLGFKSKAWKFILCAILYTIFDFGVMRTAPEALRIIVDDVFWLAILCLLCKGSYILKFYTVIVQDSISALIGITFLICDFKILPIIYQMKMSINQYLTVYFIESTANALIRLAILFLFLKCICNMLKLKDKQVNTYQGLYLLVPCLASYSFSVIFYVIQEFKIDNKKYNLSNVFPEIYYILPFISFGLLVSILITAYTFRKMLDGEGEKQKNLLMEQQFELQLTHSKNIEGLYCGIRSVMHDMNNHIACLKNLANDNRIDDIKKYIDNIGETIGKLDFKIKTGNPISDAVINEKYNIAQAENIDFLCDFIIPKEISIEPVDLCIILSNVLDNAIEACTSINISNIPKEIRIKSYVKNMYLIIEVSNTKNNKFQYDGDKIISTKSDSTKHGMGIYNIEAAVKKYNGILDIVEEKNRVTINIMMPCKNIN